MSDAAAAPPGTPASPAVAAVGSGMTSGSSSDWASSSSLSMPATLSRSSNRRVKRMPTGAPHCAGQQLVELLAGIRAQHLDDVSVAQDGLGPPNEPAAHRREDGSDNDGHLSQALEQAKNWVDHALAQALAGIKMICRALRLLLVLVALGLVP